MMSSDVQQPGGERLVKAFLAFHLIVNSLLQSAFTSAAVAGKPSPINLYIYMAFVVFGSVFFKMLSMNC